MIIADIHLDPVVGFAIVIFIIAGIAIAIRVRRERKNKPPVKTGLQDLQLKTLQVKELGENTAFKGHYIDFEFIVDPEDARDLKCWLNNKYPEE